MTLTVGELLSLSQRNSITKPFLLKATRGANTENNNKYNTTNQTATVSVIKSQVYGKHLHIFVFKMKKMKNIEFYIMVLQNT